MPESKADIDYTSDGEETTFSANTPAGKKFLDSSELTVRSMDAADFIAEARAAGLIVQPLFD
jgi:hypothetical protein